MKSLVLFLIFYSIPFHSPAQSSVANIYEAHTFPCDTGTGTVEINICSGAKAEFADSLLNRLYKSILRTIDKEIKADQIALAREKMLSKTPDKDQIYFRTKSIDQNQRLKKAIINSQRQWIKTRDANVEIAHINCEGGSSCNAMSNEAYTEETLDRIRKLESLMN
ncbi:lysozyme inhibitor LprI family protein [Ferruginibacter sp. SUN106]|uniref:lysozyme inhibitor LprI family protein n=1 Tax=Ferruginibacter sp. SUN106 TaxID=2978348 RepID=UPI003D360BEF